MMKFGLKSKVMGDVVTGHSRYQPVVRRRHLFFDRCAKRPECAIALLVEKTQRSIPLASAMQSSVARQDVR